MEINREWPSSTIPLSTLKLGDDYVRDELTIEKFTKFLSGKVKVYASRLPIESIKPGFYIPEKEGLRYIYTKPKPHYVESVKNSIRQGARPSIYLYSNIKKGEELFLCTDDIHAYTAYLELGIKSVPVSIYSSKKGLTESAYALKAATIPSGINEYIDGFEHFDLGDKLSSWDQSTNSIIDFLKELLVKFKSTKTRLKEFHYGDDDYHYHHTIYSILNRFEKSILSMLILIENKLYVNLANIVRSIYELSLIFYIDWLAPNLMNRYMQLVSVTTDKERKKIIDEVVKQQIKKGIKKSDVNSIKVATNRCSSLATNVSEKAKMFIYSEAEHKDIYSELSRVAHHDFYQTQKDLSLLTSAEEKEYSDDTLISMINLIDTLACTVLKKINEDIGYV